MVISLVIYLIFFKKESNKQTRKKLKEIKLKLKNQIITINLKIINLNTIHLEDKN
jgi:hypothetical protein